jgi:hypothetical protein
MEAAVRGADEKRRELAQADPEGREYAYRVVWDAKEEKGVAAGSSKLLGKTGAEQVKENFERDGFNVWVERALVGDWERV